MPGQQVTRLKIEVMRRSFMTVSWFFFFSSFFRKGHNLYRDRMRLDSMRLNSEQK